MTKANSNKTPKTLTTIPGGQATWNYKIAQDPKGQYSVSATATFNGQNASSTTPATFNGSISEFGGGWAARVLTQRPSQSF
jgi:hypothetical protein